MKFNIKKIFYHLFINKYYMLSKQLYSNNQYEGIDDFGIISLMYHRFEETNILY